MQPVSLVLSTEMAILLLAFAYHDLRTRSVPKYLGYLFFGSSTLLFALSLYVNPYLTIYSLVLGLIVNVVVQIIWRRVIKPFDKAVFFITLLFSPLVAIPALMGYSLLILIRTYRRTGSAIPLMTYYAPCFAIALVLVAFAQI